MNWPLPLTFALLLARAAGVRLVLWRPRTLWIRSLAGSFSMVCTFYALTRLPVAQVLTVTQMFPIWVALLSWPLAGEAPGGGEPACCLPEGEWEYPEMPAAGFWREQPLPVGS